jgi:hypothetical protein
MQREQEVSIISRSLTNSDIRIDLVLELGASTSLPSLLASTFDPPPESILTTDYPDESLISYAHPYIRILSMEMLNQ